MTGGGGEAKSTNAVQIFGNVFISFIGAGVLGLPYAFKEAGFLEGVFIMSMVAILSTQAMLMLMSCKDRVALRVKNSGAMNEVWPHARTQVTGENTLVPTQTVSNGHQSSRHSNGVRKGQAAQTRLPNHSLLALSSSEEDVGDGSDYELMPVRKPKKKVVYYESYHHLKNKDLDYADVAEFALGYFGKLTVELSLVVSQTGFCCAYLIFIQENLTDFVPSIEQSVVYYESYHHLKNKELDYADVAEFALGYFGKLTVELSLVVSQTGFCCAYLIFIQENLTDFVPSIEQATWLLGLLPVLAGLCFYRNLNSLSIFSILADCANVFAYLIVFYFDFSQHHTVSKHPKYMTLQGFPFFLGIALYCYEGAGMILALEASVHPSARHLFKGIFKLVMLIVTTLYIVFGAAGYLSFGKETQPIITLNLPDSIFPHLVKACLCFSLIFTYPMMMFPVVQLLEAKLLPEHSQVSAARSSNNSSSATSKYMPGNVLRCSLVCVTGVIVIAIPNFSVLMALVGSTCCTLLAFILPAIFHLYLFHEETSICQLALNYSLIFIGTLGALMGTWDALCRLFPTLSIFAIFNSAKETILSFVH